MVTFGCARNMCVKFLPVLRGRILAPKSRHSDLTSRTVPLVNLISHEAQPASQSCRHCHGVPLKILTERHSETWVRPKRTIHPHWLNFLTSQVETDETWLKAGLIATFFHTAHAIASAPTKKNQAGLVSADLNIKIDQYPVIGWQKN